MKQEIKKLWNIQMILFAVLCLILTIISASTVGRWSLSENDEVYRWYLKEFEGPLNQNNLKRIDAEQQMLDRYATMDEEVETGYYDGAVSWEEYSAYVEKITYARSHQEAFQRMLMDVSRLQMSDWNDSWTEVQLFDQKYWEYYFQTDTISYWILFLVIALALRCYYMEKSSGMLPILKASVTGTEGVMDAKVLVVGLSSAAVGLVCCIARFLTFLFVWKLPAGTAAIQSISGFENVSVPLTLVSASLIQCLVQAFGFMIVGMLTVGVASVVRQEVLTAAAILAVVFVPHAIVQSTGGLCQYNLFSYLNGTAVLQLLESITAIGLLILTMVLWQLAAECIYRIGSRL